LKTKAKCSIVWLFGCSASPGTAVVSQTRDSSGMVSYVSTWPLAGAEGKSIKIGQACTDFPGVWSGLLTACCDGTSWADDGIYILCLPVFTGLLV